MIGLEEYSTKLNKLGELNTRITKSLGLEHYLSTFSANMLEIMKQFLKFVEVFDNDEKFLSMLNETIDKEIEFLDFDPEVFNEKSIFKKRKKLKTLYAYNLANITSIQEEVDKINDYIDKKIQAKMR